MRRFFHYFTPVLGFFALAILVLLVLDLVLPVKPFRDNEFEGLLLAIIVVALVTIFLFWLFFRNRKKFRKGIAQKIIVPVDPYHSRFYNRFKGLVSLFDGRSFQGFGTTDFTYADQQPDGSVTVTRWLVLAFFPIVPLYRQRVRIKSTTTKLRLFYSIKKHEMDRLEKVPLNKKLDRTVYLFYYLFFYPMVLLPVVLLLIFLKDLLYHFPGPSFWWLILFYMVWGISLVALTEAFNKRFFMRKKM